MKQCRFNKKIICDRQWKTGKGLWSYKPSCENCEAFIKANQINLLGEKKEMPIEYKDPRKTLPAIASDEFKEGVTMTFEDEGKDVETASLGLMYVYVVSVNGIEKNLWIKPGSAKEIALAPQVPLLGKTLKIFKTGTGNGTRYFAEKTKKAKQ